MNKNEKFIYQANLDTEKYLFDSKYDNEFIGLLNEIAIRLVNFNRQDELKIKSWIKIFMIPCQINEAKKNRNLYAIKLINQMINGRLEEPFVKFAKGLEDMKSISVAEVKPLLTKKFFEQIDFKKIEKFGYLRQKQFLQLHPELTNQVRVKEEENYVYDTYNDKNYEVENPNKSQTNYHSCFIKNYNNIFAPFSKSSSSSNKKSSSLNKNSSKKKSSRSSNNINSINNIDKIRLFEPDKFKLISIIQELEKRIKDSDELIESQSSEIEELKNEVAKLLQKTKLVKNHQLNKQQNKNE